MRSPETELRQVDPAVWHACSGIAVKIPAVGSRAVYFPQGHIEQASSLPNLAGFPPLSKPYLLSRLLSVLFLADPLTDQLFLRLSLDPRPSSESPPPPLPAGRVKSSFVKVLTPTDVNTGSGLHVPKVCSEGILPPLDLSVKTPAQDLSFRDVVGGEWTFRHVYTACQSSGNHHRLYLLTTGWSRFVGDKKLVAGDSVAFIKNHDGYLYVGIRRAKKWNGRGRVRAEQVEEAVRAAVARDRVFEVDYYPWMRSPEFVVGEEEVVKSRRVRYQIGAEVRMGVRSEETKMTVWCYGLISRLVMPETRMFAYSPCGCWRYILLLY